MDYNPITMNNRIRCRTGIIMCNRIIGLGFFIGQHGKFSSFGRQLHNVFTQHKTGSGHLWKRDRGRQGDCQNHHDVSPASESRHDFVAASIICLAPFNVLPDTTSPFLSPLKTASDGVYTNHDNDSNSKLADEMMNCLANR
jgi:hypothetical protein